MGHAIYCNRGDIGGYRSLHRFADRVDDMTDQQAPERIFADLNCGTWFEDEPFNEGEDAEYIRADLLEAAEKRIAELEEVLRCERLLVRDFKADLEIVNHDKAKAEAERDELAAEVERLKGDLLKITNPSETKLVSFRNGSFEFSSPIVELMGEYLAQMLEAQGGEPANYAEIAVSHQRLGEMTLTLQRRSGKTPHQFRKEAEAERDQALASVGAVIENLREYLVMKTGVSQEVLIIIGAAARAINSDATAALNEMLAEAWDEGRLSSALDRNPYRKDET